MGTGDGVRGQTGRSAQTGRGEDYRELVGARVSLVCVVRLQIIIVRKSQFDVGPAKLRRQRLKRIGSANRGNRGAIERLFSGPNQPDWFAVGNVAIPHDFKLQRYDAFVT